MPKIRLPSLDKVVSAKKARPNTLEFRKKEKPKPKNKFQTYFHTILTNLKGFTLRKKESVPKRPTSLPHPQKVYLPDLSINKAMEEYKDGESPELASALEFFPERVTKQIIGQPSQGAQARVKFIVGVTH